MYKINFLTPEYKNKLKRDVKIKKYLNIILVFLLIEGIVFTGLYLWNKEIEKDIAYEQELILGKEGEMAKLEKEMSEIPDLTDKIRVVEDVFSNEDFRISTVLNSLEEIAPLNIWFNSLVYDNGKIVITGVSFKNPESNLPSEKNLYDFEKKLLKSGLYKSVNHEFTKTLNQNGLEVNSFKFNLNLK